MTQAETIAKLRARIATVSVSQHAALRRELEKRGIAWEQVAPEVSTQRPRPERLPLLPSQLHVWVLQQLYPRSPAYHIAFAWRFRGPLDVPALGRALQHVVDRHETLRTGFPTEDGAPWQDVRERCPLTLECTDLRSEPERFDALAGTFANAPFDLTAPPLMRVHLYRLGEHEHTLAFVVHHIVADGWSRGVLLRELPACYRACMGDMQPVLPPLPKAFADIVLEREAWLESADHERQKAYWRRRLDGLAPQSLPSDRPRGAGRELGAATIVRRLPQDLSARSRAAASRLGTTLFVTLLATFMLLLHRHSGQDDLAVGVPTAGRRDPDAAGLIGLFVNTLVLRATLEPGLTFRDWLDRLREALADALEHQDIPFARVVDVVGVERSAGQNPLFQALFQAQTEGYREQNAERLDFGVAGLETRQEIVPLAEAKFDLSWHMFERADGLALTVEYRPSLFDADRIERMIGHFETLLAAVADAPDRPLSHLDHLPVGERASLLALGEGERRPLPLACVHDVIAAEARRSPDRPALIANGRVWSYAELDGAADALARRIAAHPAAALPGARIALCLPRGADLLVAILASMKAGAAYVPLDPDHPADRIAHILEDADVAMVLAHGPGEGCVPRIDPSERDVAAECGSLPQSDRNALAYVMYTSGSTGRPKGVPITHASLLNLLRSMARVPGMSQGDRLLAVTTVAFDIAGLELLLPLTVGGTVVLADRDTTLSMPRLAAALDEHGITHMQATPATWRLLLDDGWQGRPELVALCGGEALEGPLAARLLERTQALWNLYGPTETTIWSGALRVEPRHLSGPAVAIGGPIDNTRFHVLDADLRPTPLGVAGELFIGGAGLSPGYWRRPDLTAERFVASPFADERATAPSLYRTGDRVVRHANGEMTFLGRVDHQLKLRGYRIEAGEIESLLQEEPAVAQALVVLDGERQRLVAYCRLASGHGERPGSDVETELRRALAARLPRHMMPSAFVLLEAFPLNTNGKVDRKRLPAPDATSAVAGAKTPPRTDAERALLAAWQAVLGREDIGVEDNFFDLGGDSVSAMRIVARAKAMGYAIEPTELFEHQTVATQARVARAIVALSTAPLSAWQRAVRDIETPPWLLAVPVGTAPVAAIEKAVRAVSAHHPVLGLRLDRDAWRPGAPVPAIVTVEAGDDAAFTDWARTAVQEKDAARWALGIVNAGTTRRLLLAVHSILLDAPSLGWLARDLRIAVDGLAAGAEPTLPPSGDYPAWLRRDGSDAPECDEPKGGGTGEAASFTIGLDPDETARVLEAARSLDTDVETLVLTALARTLAGWNGTETARIDLLTAGRTGAGPGLDRTLGQFTRRLPLDVRLPAGGTATAIEAATKAIAAASETGMPGMDEAQGDALLTFQALDAADGEWLSVPAPDRGSDHSLVLNATLRTLRLELGWRHEIGRWQPAAAQRLASRHRAELTSIRAEAPQPAARLDLLLTRLKARKD
ncbi:amino acid adenylation domain-containing protein [Marinivivus vitaminiproducens]|uniref:amino acid adenylation domain-containing protein n=1 Tax=Marinivivus vitaminiproducens TaxID=3035935 RepID=UPI0027A79D3C|nr:amino acid adenylation domain-containing protein [Geminicoccaceae bacterium SCSIO 64248]